MIKNGKTVLSLTALTLTVIIFCLIGAGCSDTEEVKGESGGNSCINGFFGSESGRRNKIRSLRAGQQYRKRSRRY